MRRTRQRASRGASYRARRNRNTNPAASTNQAQAQTNPFADVVVSAHPVGARASVRPIPNAVMAQRDASFVPRVLAVTVGTEVQFINEDRFFHNVFSLTPGASFNIGRRRPGVTVTQRLNEVGEIKVFCDIHSQMRGSVLVLDTPYFGGVAPDGSFRLDGVPPGRYELRAFHPDFTELRTELTVAAGGARFDFNFMS